ncbi:hypothetical protein AAF712_005098 [Marasmius tenuissimus]|uniref:Uncharacterized protein n=1 Tax=Marasmius tenuissimus TaxID=585030 RepID=A0ABR3A4K3_9AGAR
MENDVDTQPLRFYTAGKGDDARKHSLSDFCYALGPVLKVYISQHPNKEDPARLLPFIIKTSDTWLEVWKEDLEKEIESRQASKLKTIQRDLIFTINSEAMYHPFLSCKGDKVDPFDGADLAWEEAFEQAIAGSGFEKRKDPEYHLSQYPPAPEPTPDPYAGWTWDDWVEELRRDSAQQRLRLQEEQEEQDREDWTWNH